MTTATEIKSRSASGRTTGKTLFPTTLPERQWLQFEAAGFPQPVSGAIFRAAHPPCCGVPLGGISTGCLDIDARGVFGFSSLFNPGAPHPIEAKWRIPRKLPTIQPFLALSVGERTWVLAAQEMISGGEIGWCSEPQMQEPRGKQPPAFSVPVPTVADVNGAQEIHYWGHYPVADLEYETDAPVAVGLRAWSPFIPGDAAASNTPAALFEVHLRNLSDQPQAGRIAFSFPGPDPDEARTSEFTRLAIHEDLTGILVAASSGVQYLLGVLGAADVAFGAGLSGSGQSWSALAGGLPQPSFRQQGATTLYQDGSCAAAVAFDLQPGANRVIRFLLTWYAPDVEGVRKRWEGRDVVVDGILRYRWLASPWTGDTDYFSQMYATRFGSALEVARYMAANHTDLWQRISAWQQEIYTDTSLPIWLQDSLVNNLALIAEDSHWFQARQPLGEWAFPHGAFALNESPRGCPHMSCIPCDWYGNLPIVYFFPELARSNLLAFQAYQLESGEIPFAIGRIGELPDMATPEYHWQVSLNGMCYIDMVDRLWQRTGDLADLRTFYASVKRCNTFTMGLHKGPGGPIRMPEAGGMEWFEFGEWAGLASHMGGLRLAQLRMVERMAVAMGDHDYAQKCRAWYTEGSRAMEEQLWAGSYYLNFYEPETGKRSDDVMGYQLDGEWAARYHGLPGVFPAERVTATLETIRRCNIALTPEIGAANFARPDGTPLPADSRVAAYGLYAMFPPELLVLAMTYIYAGQHAFGLELARKHWQALALDQGHAWDLPNIVRGDTGQRVFGTDYYQNMMLWALPAALAGQEIAGSCAPGSLIDKVYQIGRQPDEA